MVYRKYSEQRFLHAQPARGDAPSPFRKIIIWGRLTGPDLCEIGSSQAAPNYQGCSTALQRNSIKGEAALLMLRSSFKKSALKTCFVVKEVLAIKSIRFKSSAHG